MSFISSFSDSFQKKNIKMTLNDTIKDIKVMDNILYNNNLLNNKLYLSCFNDCPIEGNINYDSILFNLVEYTHLKSFDEICLSDTTGNLKYEDFKELINNITKLINANKLSLHLHFNKENEDNLLEIINHGLKYSITKLDISSIEDGGCSVTMDKSKLNSNLTYDILNKLLTKLE
tara:strand:- start:242 stop:766 length:525 start_codon:yes stop_codon:yes gene_type:complete